MRSPTGQTTIEYLFMLFIVVALFLVVNKKLIQPILGKLPDQLSEKLNATLFTGDLHSLKVSR